MATTADIEALGEFTGRGFSLEEDGDDIVFLMHEGQPIARFSQRGATPHSFQSEAALHLTVEHGLIATCATTVPKK